MTRESLEPACGSAAQYLKQYQLLGVNFLMHLARAGVSGAILADDMGLGKTCQLISFLGALGLTAAFAVGQLHVLSDGSAIVCSMQAMMSCQSAEGCFASCPIA